MKMRWIFGLLALLTLPAHAQQSVRYIHTDGLGSVVAVTDGSRNVIERREYEPFGAQLTPAVQDGPGYTGHVQDAATGLTYMQQRYYDPRIGRFVTVDPVSARPEGDNFNRYNYAFNNPYRFTDPDGREGAAVTAKITGQCDHCLGNGPPPEGSASVLAAAGTVVVGGLFAPQTLVGVIRFLGRDGIADSPVVAGISVGRNPGEARAALEAAGHGGRRISNDAGTETGTLHNIRDMKMDVRVMDGGPKHPARIVTTREGTRQPVNPANGRNFGNIPRGEQRTGSHIVFRERKK